MARKLVQAAARSDPLEEEGLLTTILAALPLPKIFQLRMVCKLWNSVLTSPAFQTAWSTRHNHHEGEAPNACCSPWLVMVRNTDRSVPPFHTRELIAFDSGLRTWIALGALSDESGFEPGPEAEAETETETELGNPSSGLLANPFILTPNVLHITFVMAVGSQGGLACFVCSPHVPSDGVAGEILKLRIIPSYVGAASYACDYKPYYIRVLNPVTGSHSIIPPALIKHTNLWESPDYMISLQDLPHQQYRVFLVKRFSDKRYPGDLEIYDSRTRCWMEASSCRSHTDAKFGDVDKLESADFLHLSCEAGIAFGYSVELDEWRQLSVNLSFWPARLKAAKDAILILRGTRVLVAAVQLDAQTALTGFGVWELRQRAILDHSFNDAAKPDEVVDLVEVARTPRHLWEGFYELETEGCPKLQAKLIHSGGLICMTVAHIWTGIYERKYHVPLVYDLDKNLWYHLPPYKGHYDSSALFGLQPSLATVALF